MTRFGYPTSRAVDAASAGVEVEQGGVSVVTTNVLNFIGAAVADNGGTADIILPIVPPLESGSYIPLIGITSGIETGTRVSHTAHWMRVGNIVTVTGWVEGRPLQVGLLCDFTVDLPRNPSPAFAEKDRLSGVASAIDTTTRTSTSCPVIARTAGNAQQAEFFYMPTATNMINFEYSFMYSLV